MVACPLLLLFYFGSFKEFAKKHSQLYISLFAVTLGICLYITVRLLGIETPFRIETGNATMNFMLVLGLLALLPLSVISTVFWRRDSGIAHTPDQSSMEAGAMLTRNRKLLIARLAQRFRDSFVR